MEYDNYVEKLAHIEPIFADDEKIDKELGYPEDHEYYEE